MKISAVTLCGAGKAKSEDRVLVGGKILCNEHYYVEYDLPVAVGVADGVGGNAGGGRAAQFVCERLSAAELTEENAAEINNELISLAWKTPGFEAMGTTFSGVVGNKILHIGNTRVYSVQGGYLKQLTSDMTTYNYLRSIGRLEESEQCSRSEITACFGGGRRSLFRPQLLDFTPAGTVVITSDGVHDYLEADVMESILAQSTDDLSACKTISEKAKNSGSEDDVSVVLVRF